MMRTPSLRARVVTIGVAVLFLVIVILDIVVYSDLRRRLMAGLDEVLDDRAQIVQAEALRVPIAELPSRLTELGIVATIRTPDGAEFRAQPPSPAIGANLPGRASSPEIYSSREVRLSGGGSATVYARRSSVDSALSRLVRMEIAGTFVAITVAGLLLWWASRLMLGPLRQMAASARRTSAGQPGLRLRPDRPDTQLGAVASAYDEMVDALETALCKARTAESRASAAHHRSRQILETAREAYVAVDSSHRITEWNRQAAEMFGWTRDDVIGRPADEFLPLDDVVEAASSNPAAGDVVARHRDGSEVCIQISAWTTDDESGRGLNALIGDVTERRRGEEAVHQLAAIVDSAREAIISTTLDLKVLSWNSGAEQLYGFSAAEAIGGPLAIIVPSAQQPEMERCAERIRQGFLVPRYETVHGCKNGTLVEVAITASPVRSRDGAVIAQSVIVRDITEQRWMARTLDDTLVSLEVALAEAQRAEARMRTFVDDAAHQLRSPITGIRATAEALLRTDNQADQERLLAAMVQEVSKSSRLISNLLRLARMDGGPALLRTSCDIGQLCEVEVERIRRRSSVDVEVSVDGTAPSGLFLDATAISEILCNVLENGARHAASRIEVSVGATEESVEIRISDDGPGLPPEKAELAFERFVSLDGKGGSGLGLSIARDLARAHGGDLTYEDGSFVLRTPLQQSVVLAATARSLEWPEAEPLDSRTA